MVRLFHVYYPVRTLVLLLGELAAVCLSFVLATVVQLGPDSYLVLNYEYGYWKILLIAVFSVLCSYYFDLYAPQLLNSTGETYFRLLVVLSVLSFGLAGIAWIFPEFPIQDNVFLIGLIILTFTLVAWRWFYFWLLRRPLLRERVYVLGSGERAKRAVSIMRERTDLGMEVVGWAGAMGDGNGHGNGSSNVRDDMVNSLVSACNRMPIDRIIVGMNDRRGTMPVSELLNARLNGIRIEDATSLLEKVSGKIELEGLHPSALIFSDGFRLNESFLIVRRVISTLIAFTVLLVCLPLIPLVMLAIKLDSKGPIFFRQERVGRKGKSFWVVKFRTMRTDAEAKGAQWAKENDPRITRIGRFLRKTRVDEIPQLWNVLKGDMGFFGPRPERPEFVQWLSRDIPYYSMRHIIRPGLTGWAQVRYRYGSSLEDTKQKLQYDLYYIKHMSLSLDLLILFETVKTVVLRRGAQ